MAIVGADVLLLLAAGGGGGAGLVTWNFLFFTVGFWRCHSVFLARGSALFPNVEDSSFSTDCELFILLGSFFAALPICAFKLIIIAITSTRLIRFIISLEGGAYRPEVKVELKSGPKGNSPSSLLSCQINSLSPL